MMSGPRIGASAPEKSKACAAPPWLPADRVGIVRPSPTGLAAVTPGDRVDDLQIAWLMIGWLLAFWAGKDLQARFARRRASRRGE
jgi:hypothetical protein